MFRLVIVAQNVERSPQALPLGAASVSAALSVSEGLKGRIHVDLVEVEPGGASAQTAELIAAKAPDAVGFSVYSWNRTGLGEAARLLRALKPELLLFAGGPETTADPSGILAEFDLDFAVLGEGESVSVAALGLVLEDRAEALALLAGIAVPARDSSGGDGAARAAPAEDPETLVSPWLSATIDPAHYGGALWELTRGCPYRCAYCYESKGNAGLRRMPMERIVAELDLFVRRGVPQVFVLDPTFNADRRRAAQILDLIRDRGAGIRWKFEVRAELLDRVLVRQFAAISCSLQIGLQSADPDVLACVGRSLDRELFRRKIALLDEAGVTFGLDLIYGLPGESLDGLRASLDYALALQPNHLDLFPLALLPSTELADTAASLGIVADPRPPYLVRSTRELPAEDFDRAASLAAACDLFYSRGRAVSWFLQALRPLRLKPAAFLGRFAAWRQKEPSRLAELPDSHTIEEMQLAFLEECYQTAKLDPLLPALRDIVRFNAAWGRAIVEGETTEIELSYDADDVLGPAALDLPAFAKRTAPRPQSISVLPAPGVGARIRKGRISSSRRGMRGRDG